MSVFRFSRKAGSDEQYAYKQPKLVAAKEVFIGQRDPGHWRATEVSHEFVPVVAKVKRVR
jgi:hypothetical protein